MDFAGIHLDWSLIIKVVIFLAIITLIFRFVGSMIRIALVIVVVIAGIWLFKYVTAGDFSADKLTKDLGAVVHKVDDMSPQIVETAGDTIKVIKDTGSKVSFKKKGLEFNGSKNQLKGSIALVKGKVQLHATAPASDGSSIKSLVAIVNVFAGSDGAGSKIKNMVKTKENQHVEINGGYIDIKDGELTIEYTK